MPEPDAPRLQLHVDGVQVEVPDDGASLLEVLRDRLGVRSPKDGCSPQGQCGCCTVLVDGSPRVSCVTPARRVRGREVTTLDGLEPAVRAAWAASLTACGGSQCGFCTPGIVVRLEGLRSRGGDLRDRVAVDKALGAHLCRCTGWQTIVEAAATFGEVADGLAGRDPVAAAARAELEGGAPQQVGPPVALGEGGFADDGAPLDALVAVPDGRGGWAVADHLHEARRAAGKVQGRRSTVVPTPPLEVPPGAWDATLRTCWVEPAYLETDASWCAPGGEPSTPLANGGAFGAKGTSPLPAVARRLADERGRAVRVLWSREDVVRDGPKRPPVAGGVRADGTGVLHVVRTEGVAHLVAAAAPSLEVEELDVPGPATSAAIRGAGWVEALVLLAGGLVPGTSAPGGAVSVTEAGGVSVRAPGGGAASAHVRDDGSLHVAVDAGAPLDEVVLRSYVIGAAHQAASWVTSEALAVDPDGAPVDLTIRSFRILRAASMPAVAVEVAPSTAEPVRAADAVLAAVAGALWRHLGCPAVWPSGDALR